MTYKGFSRRKPVPSSVPSTASADSAASFSLLRRPFRPQADHHLPLRLNALCAFLIFHVIPQTSAILYIVGGLMGIGLHAIYVLGYTIAQDGVSTSQIGLATGIVGASSYFLSFFSGPLMGFLTTTLGHVAALDIIVVAFESCLFIVALLMKETQNRHLSEKTDA